MFAKLKQKTLEDKPKPVVQKSSQQDAEEPSKSNGAPLAEKSPPLLTTPTTPQSQATTSDGLQATAPSPTLNPTPSPTPNRPTTETQPQSPPVGDVIPKQSQIITGSASSAAGGVVSALSPTSSPSPSTVKYTTPPPPLPSAAEGVITVEQTPPAAGGSGQLSGMLTRLKKKVVDSSWQGSESKVHMQGQQHCLVPPPH